MEQNGHRKMYVDYVNLQTKMLLPKELPKSLVARKQLSVQKPAKKEFL